MQPDAEHQQHHADLGQLRRDVAVGHETGRERPDDDARHEVAHQRRHAQPRGHEAQQQRQAERGGECLDQSAMGHAVHFAGNGAAALEKNHLARTPRAAFRPPQPQPRASARVISAAGALRQPLAFWPPHRGVKSVRPVSRAASGAVGVWRK